MGFTWKARDKKVLLFYWQRKSIANLTVQGNYGDWLEPWYFKTCLEAITSPSLRILFSSSLGSRQMLYIISSIYIYKNDFFLSHFLNIGLRHQIWLWIRDKPTASLFFIAWINQYKTTSQLVSRIFKKLTAVGYNLMQIRSHKVSVFRATDYSEDTASLPHHASSKIHTMKSISFRYFHCCNLLSLCPHYIGLLVQGILLYTFFFFTAFL